MDADAERVQDGRIQLLERPVHASGQNGIVGSLVPQCTVAQFGGEPGVAPVETMLANTCRQDEVGVSVLRRDRAQHLKSHQPGGICPAGALRRGALGEVALLAAVPPPALRVAGAGSPPAAALARSARTRSAAAGTARSGSASTGVAHWNTTLSREAWPRAQSAAAIIFLPAGCTLVSSTACEPVPTSTPFPAKATRPG